MIHYVYMYISDNYLEFVGLHNGKIYKKGHFKVFGINCVTCPILHVLPGSNYNSVYVANNKYCKTCWKGKVSIHGFLITSPIFSLAFMGTLESTLELKKSKSLKFWIEFCSIKVQ